MILVGGNSPVQGFTGRARAASLALGDQIMLWMPSASGENAIKGVNIVRLPNWRADQDTTSYLRDISSTVSKWSTIPNAIYQLGNEPDLEAGHMGERIGEFAAALRAVLPWARVGNPPLSVANSAHVNADGCDAVLMHSYFERQFPATAQTEQFGLSYMAGMRIANGRPVYVTEFNAVQTGTALDWNDRNQQVARWIDAAEVNGVAGVCLFIFDASPDWSSFDVGPEAAVDITMRRAVLPPAPPQPPIPPLPPEPPVVVQRYSRDYDPRGYRPLDPRWLSFIRQHNAAEADAIFHTYDEACRIIGYDANAAVAQGCVECTAFTSQRWRNAHAAAGIGIYGDGTPDVIWGPAPHGDVLTGVRAQAELLGDYYCGGKEPWGILAAHRFGGMNLGKTSLRQMDGVWAADTGYSAAIVQYLADVLGGAIIETPTFVSGEQVVAEAMKDLGHDTFLDEGVTVPSYYRCEEAVEVWEERCGLGRLRYNDALEDAYSGPLNTTFPAPVGARVFFEGPGWSVYGHVGTAMADGGVISALSVVKISYGWQSLAAGCIGWRYAPGVGPGDATPKYRKMRVATVGDGFNAAELKRIHFGTDKPTATMQKNFPYNPDFGIEQAFAALLNGTFNYGDQDFRGLSISPGQCISKEEFDGGTPGRSVRYYQNGKITALKQADGQYTFRWN
jgi:hypothetical protein